MKRDKVRIKIIARRVSAMAIPALLLLLAAGCGGGEKNAEGSESEATERPDSATAARIEVVREAIVKGDARKFASSVSYPIERPYPLRDIKDSTEMEKYFNVIADDSLKSAMKERRPSDWEGYGWRGWSDSEGKYLWFDGEKVYAVDYVSVREREMIDSLRRDEMASLDSGLRGGWVPVKVLKATGDGTVFRIDRDSLVDDDTDGVTVRLAVYAPRSDYHKRPHRMMKGRLRHEGTIGTRIYEFTDSTGNRAEYNDMQTAPDEPLDIIEVTSKGDTVARPVIPVYWRDILQSPQ